MGLGVASTDVSTGPAPRERRKAKMDKANETPGGTIYTDATEGVEDTDPVPPSDSSEDDE